MGAGMAPAIGYIGLGNMGGPMARRLLAAGLELHVWGRSAAKLEPYVAEGARACGAPRDVAERAAIVFTCLSDTEAVREVVFGAGGIAEGGAKDRILIDMSTISPDATIAMAEALSDRCGMRWIDAPISGGTTGAESGTLAVMAGGSAADLDAVRPILAHLARNVTLMGPIGAGQATKLINQIFVGCTMTVVAEALRLAVNAGIDAAQLPRALAGGRGDSQILQQLGPRMLAGDFTLTSTVDSLIKDFGLIEDMARRAGAAVPMTSLAATLYRLLRQHGHGGDDNTAICKVFGESRLD